MERAASASKRERGEGVGGGVVLCAVRVRASEFSGLHSSSSVTSLQRRGERVKEEGKQNRLSQEDAVEMSCCCRLLSAMDELPLCFGQSLLLKLRGLLLL